jgi:hypothetical protein
LVADVLSKNSWSAATPRRHLTGRDEGCPLFLRYAVWRGKMACVSFLSGYAEVAGCEFVKDNLCRDVVSRSPALPRMFYSSFPVNPEASLGEWKTQLDCLLRHETSLAVASGGHCVADAEIPR